MSRISISYWMLLRIFSAPLLLISNSIASAMPIFMFFTADLFCLDILGSGEGRDGCRAWILRCQKSGMWKKSYVNQEKIVEEGGLDALLMLLQSCQNIAVLGAASGAIANLAMNEMNQCLIMNKGGACLLASTASKTDDPQALRMVAGVIANLCGHEKFHLMLGDDGAIKALLGMARSGNSYVIARVARGIANFAKCESREIIQAHRRGRSVLIEDNVLSWLIVSSTTVSASSRRHFELALRHLAQNEDSARDFISSGRGESARTHISRVQWQRRL
ncbi:hypothetical protein Vadar_029610 [Vaccinium darrowii]|uniref:Uncharacterized protein n=1 Tax=Vaccinium darrowii TaxID=229202 RepID=A0ACB7YQC9_9ERIC|nr:hypothetical protein Vadar_029610 [Vaccinium darrowii]